MIPKVRRWRVTWWNGRTKLASTVVFAPTKFLARLAARDHYVFERIWEFDWNRVTYYVERAPKQKLWETPSEAKNRQQWERDKWQR